MDSVMPHFKVAHLREQGQDMIIVPLDSSFGNKASGDQRQMISELQVHARAAGLAGTVVPVWETGGRMNFIAPQPWHPFLRSLNLRFIWMSINKELSW
jgi:hypothetical protein